MTQKQFAINASLAVAVIMLVGKFSAYLLTDSTAILSDAAESVIHIFATSISVFSLWFADKPADEKHPYGHGKIVLFSIGLEGLLIFSSAIFIIIKGLIEFINGPELHKLDSGLIIIAVLTCINLSLGLYLKRVGKKEGSQVLIANGKHVLTDMWTSAVVVLGVAIVWLTGFALLDPLIAIAAGVHILYTGGHLMRDATTIAMDEVSPADTKVIRNVLDTIVSEGLIGGYHQLRYRRVNDVYWIELHLLVPGELTVSDAHVRATEVEARLAQAFPLIQVYVTSHIEPTDHNSAHPEGHVGDPLGS